MSVNNSLTNKLTKTFDLNVPTDMNDVMSIIKDSMNFFGVKATYRRIFYILGGLPDVFIYIALLSMSESKRVFSYDLFKSYIIKFSPIIKVFVDLSTSAVEIDKYVSSKLPVTALPYAGSENLYSLDSISKVFSFVNNMYMLSSYSQDTDVVATIKALIQEYEDSQKVFFEPTAEEGITGTSIVSSTSPDGTVVTPSTDTSSVYTSDILSKLGG